MLKGIICLLFVAIVLVQVRNLFTSIILQLAANTHFNIKMFLFFLHSIKLLPHPDQTNDRSNRFGNVSGRGLCGQSLWCWSGARWSLLPLRRLFASADMRCGSSMWYQRKKSMLSVLRTHLYYGISSGLNVILDICVCHKLSFHLYNFFVINK